MFFQLAQILWLAAPVVLGNLVHFAFIKYDWLAGLRVPLDAGLTVRGRRLFGDNKTVRGAVVITAFTVVFMGVQAFLYGVSDACRSVSLYDYAAVPWAWSGALLGLGWVLGELPNSFVKRQLGVGPGAPVPGALGRVWYLVDQLDSVVGCLLVMCLYFVPPVDLVVTVLVVGAVLHVLFNGVMYAIGIKDRIG